MIIHTLPKVMNQDSQQSAKEAVGKHAAQLVEDGMQVGLGTGSTTAFAIEELGRRVKEENLDIVGVPTSFAAERLGRKVGIPIVTLDEVDGLDLALDGADEVDPALNLIKGRGAAHTREKVVAALASRFVALVDASKLVEQLGGQKPVPVEVLPMAATPVMHQLEHLGANPIIRMGIHKDGPVVTDQGFWVIDAHFENIKDLESLDRDLLAIPGVLDHGLFIGMAETVLVAETDGSIKQMRRD